MSFSLFLVFFVLCSAAMALWIDVRFPRLVPGDLRAGVIRLGIALVVAHVGVPATAAVAKLLAHPGPVMVVLATAFAALTVLMLAGLWMFRLAHGLLGGSLR